MCVVCDTIEGGMADFEVEHTGALGDYSSDQFVIMCVCLVYSFAAHLICVRVSVCLCFSFYKQNQ